MVGNEFARMEPPVKVDLMAPLADLDQVLRVSEQLALSDLVPTALYGKPANVFHVIMTGQKLGLHWTEAIRLIYAPGRGQIGMRGEFLLAKLHEAGHEYDWEEEPGKSCTFMLERNANNKDGAKRTYKITFTIEDALAAGLLHKKDGKIVALSRDGKPLPWMAYQPDMLFWRAVARCVKRGAPEVVMGFSIQGADERNEPEPEVQLQPKGSSPPGDVRSQPVESQPVGKSAAKSAQPAIEQGTLGPAEAQARLRELDERMRGDEPAANPEVPASQDQWPEGSQGEAANPPVSGADEPASAASGASRSRQNSKQIKEKLLADLFSTLGWDLPRYRDQVRTACSVFFRRKITTMRDMQAGEMTLLTQRLEKIAHDSPSDAYPVALADAVEGWRDGWEREDPDSYGEWKEEK